MTPREVIERALWRLLYHGGKGLEKLVDELKAARATKAAPVKRPKVSAIPPTGYRPPVPTPRRAA